VIMWSPMGDRPDGREFCSRTDAAYRVTSNSLLGGGVSRGHLQELDRRAVMHDERDPDTG
jgi:hypothetical protein